MWLPRRTSPVPGVKAVSWNSVSCPYNPEVSLLYESRTENDMKRNRAPLRLNVEESALLFITMIWGATFLIIRCALEETGPLFFVGIRFASAAFVVLALSLPVLRGFTRRELLAGAGIGVSIFAGYALQTCGLQTITASKSAFITAFYVPLVPLLQWIVMRQAPGRMAWIGIALAFPGLILLSGPDGVSAGFGRGEILTALGALAIAAEIILIGLVAPEVNARRITLVQVTVASLLSFALMPVTGEQVPGFSWIVVCAACGLGLASALIQSVINWAQRRVSPTRATLIYSCEPVWGGVFGRLAGERLPALALCGGALVIAGVLISSLRTKGEKNGQDTRGTV